MWAWCSACQRWFYPDQQASQAAACPVCQAVATEFRDERPTEPASS